MTRAEAIEIQLITDACTRSIPATHVDRIFYYYQRHIDPNQRTKPCTCSPKQWTGFLFALKDKVTDVLKATESEVILP